MLTIQEFSTSIANGKKYITTIYRGSEYTLVQGAFGWTIWTRRIGYGGSTHAGSAKRFDTLADVAKSCKAFGAAEQIITLAYRV